MLNNFIASWKASPLVPLSLSLRIFNLKLDGFFMGFSLFLENKVITLIFIDIKKITTKISFYFLWQCLFHSWVVLVDWAINQTSFIIYFNEQIDAQYSTMIKDEDWRRYDIQCKFPLINLIILHHCLCFFSSFFLNSGNLMFFNFLTQFCVQGSSNNRISSRLLSTHKNIRVEWKNPFIQSNIVYKKGW